jgi:hypothetical protein
MIECLRSRSWIPASAADQTSHITICSHCGRVVTTTADDRGRRLAYHEKSGALR